ncbi:ESF1 [Lonchura striata]|uniref:ESF1 n=1 Tax=Lonchura striata TaxID=40157 RepID=A0A218URG7_9PASE|nr:ESF1 homolog [Lonchura striata domestica]XP_021383505.1 ESF1 homolog [Lonchura striata domestica]XP_021383506.1 ESF1 homolog [Lonchura striata domestica]XP_021383508.1 ESF1 homolog [Lonchura striata domestica]XP_021383509.1 ESF1 homolog [Lonchura striata domestica]XP_031360085.1 ESF1 homolog [Lonchura striata domestica]XP_031360086.1 ESF1 homolog [Lonchura striata domestica]OWK56397.1 ESF1 [Lonchura striata domestica]
MSKSSMASKMSAQEEILSDGRFSCVARDPRFWEMPEKERKVKIDKRFRAMFHDKKFKLKYTVDKRGRPVNYTTTENLRKFYALSESDSDLSESDSKELTAKKKKKKKVKGKGEGDSAKALAGGIPKEESKNAQQGVDQTCEAVTKLNDLKKEGQKSKSKFSVKEDSQKPAVEVDHSQRITGLLPKGKNKQGGVSGGRSISIQIKEKSSQGSAAKSVKAPRRDHSVGGKMKESDICDQSVQGKSQLEEETSSSEDAELEEEESEDGGETSKEEEPEDDGEMDEDDSDSEDDEESDLDEGPDLARGIGNIDTSSEDDEDLNELFPKEPEIEHSWRELDKDAPRGDEITSRLAVCNMDWDRLKAKDLLALFNCFTPKGGTVFSVKIYPSEFGKERLKEEEQKGPVELFDLPENTTEDDGIYREKLREYQFKRLKYFYAVVECDSPETANKIYEECDGLEFESSCSFIDLRFIPDNVTFDDKPKDVASEVNIAAYKPKYFTSAAMGTSKVDITWDETDHERVTSLSRTFNKEELLDMDFQAYLASSSEEEEEQQQDGDVAHEMEDDKPRKSHKDDEEQIAKYRELLQSIKEKEKKQEEKDIGMEIKWVPGLKETAEEMVKNRLEGKDNLTPWQKYLEKKKEKRILKKKRKAAAEKEESEDELPPDVDLNDPYFAEEFEKTGLKKKPESIESTSEDEDEVEKQKAEMALLMMDDEDDTRKHFNYKKIIEQQNLSKKKKKLLMKKKELLEDDFQVNVADSRFQAMFTSPLFNLDPSDPNFKKTKAVEKILEEKARRREEKEQDLKEANKGLENKMAKKGEVAKKAINPALSMLIKSVKHKTQEFQARKKQKFK